MIKLIDLLTENDTYDRGGVLYCCDGKHLLCLGENSGKWHVPKGHLQEGETPLEGSVREFTEETQISLNGIPDLLDSWDSKDGKFYLFKLEGNKKFRPRLNHEHIDWGYFEVDELPSPMNEDLEKVIKKQHNIAEGSPTSNVRGLKGATGFIRPSQWKSKKKSLKKSISNSTGYILIDTDDKVENTGDEYRTWKRPAMIKLKPLLERVDYQDTASELVKVYKLKSKIKIGSGKNFGEYIPETDTITLRPSYPNIKEFLMTILHEIGHAIDAKRIGVKKYIKKYTQAGTMAAYHGLDPHDANKWEDKAENFAKKELSKWL
jgi:ADP-ribose pyrophosphatase YjhB (NUDIX family)